VIAALRPRQLQQQPRHTTASSAVGPSSHSRDSSSRSAGEGSHQHSEDAEEVAAIRQQQDLWSDLSRRALALTDLAVHTMLSVAFADIECGTTTAAK
jgi:hypothetical protein